jgi:hypothetical protein
MNCARERCRRWAFVFAKSLDRAAPQLAASHSSGPRRGAVPAPVMLCVDVLGFHIGLEPSLELADQRRQAGHFGDRIEQRP